MPSFYEFFAGGGMARAGLGEEWTCLFANDVDPKKSASYVANWGTAHLTIDDVGKLATIFDGTLPISLLHTANYLNNRKKLGSGGGFRTLLLDDPYFQT